MKKLIMFAVLLTLTACGTVDMKLINASIDKCAPHGGLKHINENSESAICNDGAFLVTGKPLKVTLPGGETL